MIFFISRSIPVTVTGLLLALSSPTTTAAINAQPHRRINVAPDQSIADEVRNAHANGNPRPEFTIRAERAGSKEIYQVDVREAEPAVTSETTVSVQGGESKHVDEDSLDTLLVSNTEGTVALIAVEKKGGKVDGIVVSSDETIKLTQTGGQKAFARPAEEFIPPAWACAAGAGEKVDDVTDVGRFLFEDGHDDHHDLSDHDHSAHDHHDHSHDFDPSKIETALADIKHSLRGAEVRIGKHRRVQAQAYNYWVDLYIEIDRDLCNKKGELATCDAGTIGPNTMNYINAIFTGANTIYETEINTHLNILHIVLNANYATSTSTSAALTQMRTIYSRTATQGWHYTSPNGIKPDLHHAVLGKNLGGGIAYVGVICRQDYGFGLSASLTGGYTSMGSSVVWDMMVVMHELGHNFGSGHTHDSGYYSPVVDTCGTACPAGLPLAKSSTIMSYCHGCSGGYGNMDYTFGGKYSGAGSRSDVNSYLNSPLAGTVSTEPRRVNVKMWSHVSTRGTCSNIYPMGSAAPTQIPTSKPTTNKPTSVPSATPTTGNPTVSSKPTASPTTGAPTMAPTKAPTKAPTMAPSRAPTMFPTTKTPTTCGAAGTACSAAAQCCSNSCPTTGKNKLKCGAAPAQGQPKK